MKETIHWVTYTMDRDEAYKYRLIDKSENRWAKKSGTMYTKRVKLFHYDKSTKTYYLPPVTWKDTKAMFWFSYEIPMKPIMELWEWQQKAVNYCSHAFGQWVSSILIDSTVWTWKTIMMLGIIAKFKCPTLITVPTEAIWLGIQEKLQPYCDARYLNWDKIRKAWDKQQMPDILITHRQSWVNCREIINWRYDLMINDEQHHLSDGMKMMCNTRKGRWILGFTGSPYRKSMEKEDFLKYFQKIYETWLESLPVKVLTYKYFHKYSMNDYMKACEWLEPESPEVLRRLVNANEDRLQEIKKVVSKLYFNYGFKRLILFVDRKEYIEKIKAEVFPNAVIISGDTNKEQVINELKNKDEYLILWMIWACGEWFDLPTIQAWILFYTTSWKWSLEQAIGRSRRFHWDKKYWYWVDFQETARIENTYKNFWVAERMKFYKERWFEISPL